jgi:hypothetical protein
MRTKSPWLQTNRSGAYALAKIGLAAAFVTVILLVGSVAQACPKHHNTVDPVRVERSSPRLTASVTSHGTRAAIRSDATCCGAGCHSHGFGCSGGCCSMGGPAVDAAGSAFTLPSASIDIAMRDQGGGASLKPPPNDRPPRTF